MTGTQSAFILWTECSPSSLFFPLVCPTSPCGSCQASPPSPDKVHRFLRHEIKRERKDRKTARGDGTQVFLSRDRWEQKETTRVRVCASFLKCDMSLCGGERLFTLLLSGQEFSAADVPLLSSAGGWGEGGGAGGSSKKDEAKNK